MFCPQLLFLFTIGTDCCEKLYREYFEMVQMHQHENVMISLNFIKSCIDDITELY